MARSGWAAAIKRAERDAARRRRELVAIAKQQAKWQEAERAQYEVLVYENQISFLLSMHKDCGPVWDWRAVLAASPPPPPQPTNLNEVRARHDAEAYVPGIWDKLMGGAERRKAELQQNIMHAQRADADAFARTYAEYTSQVEMHQWQQRAAHAVLSGDLAAYGSVVQYLSPFDELAEAGMAVQVDALRRDVAVLGCVVSDGSIVPAEQKKLTTAGKLSSKKLAAGTYWGYYQDYVCGCALRAAREIYALLPLPRVVVNVSIPAIDTSTGHNCMRTILAVSMPRERLLGLNFDTLDASDSMANFSHRMKFKKTAGFEAVEPIDADESFVSTGRSR